jgi:hypothetical protein
MRGHRELYASIPAETSAPCRARLLFSRNHRSSRDEETKIPRERTPFHNRASHHISTGELPATDRLFTGCVHKIISIDVVNEANDMSSLSPVIA